MSFLYPTIFLGGRVCSFWLSVISLEFICVVFLCIRRCDLAMFKYIMVVFVDYIILVRAGLDLVNGLVAPKAPSGCPTGVASAGV